MERIDLAGCLSKFFLALLWVCGGVFPRRGFWISTGRVIIKTVIKSNVQLKRGEGTNLQLTISLGGLVVPPLGRRMVGWSDGLVGRRSGVALAGHVISCQRIILFAFNSVYLLAPIGRVKESKGLTVGVKWRLTDRWEEKVTNRAIAGH